MTPTEQDKELREKLSTLVHLHHYGFCENIVSRCYKAPQKYWTQECKNRAKQYEDKLVAFITADRERVALEARINENNMYIRELPRHYFPSGPGEPHIPLVQFHERIAELIAENEEV